MKKITLQIDGINCSSCVIDIDGQLEDADGVHEAVTSYVKQQTQVTYDEQKIDQQQLLVIVEQSGYTAVLAD